jgi:hypothetical protein
MCPLSNRITQKKGAPFVSAGSRVLTRRLRQELFHVYMNEPRSLKTLLHVERDRTVEDSLTGDADLSNHGVAFRPRGEVDVDPSWSILSTLYHRLSHGVTVHPVHRISPFIILVGVRVGVVTAILGVRRSSA